MQCPRCGDTNFDSDRFCSACGHDLATYRRLWTGATPQSAAAPAQTPPTALQAGPGPVAADAQASATAPVAAPTLQSAVQVSASDLPLAAAEHEAPRVPDYSTWAAVLLALCWPAFWAAIPALVHAGRAKSMLATGNLAGAQNAARRAKDWCWVTFVAGSVLWIMALGVLAAL
jgi:hypothetical protein